MNRIGLAVAGLVACGLSLGAAAADEVRLRVGIVSDVHFSGAGQKPYFKRALAFFRDHGADAVMVAGDMTNSSRPVEWQAFAESWNEIFPGDKAPDGRSVVKLFVSGNHDGGGAAEAWPKYFGEKLEPVWLKRVRGYAVVGAHWGRSKDVAAFLQAHDAELKGDRPFFFVQHPHPHGTCQGDWAWGNEPCATAALTNYPNAVAFSGHSHYPLTDERSIWQGAFTSVNTSSMSYSSDEYNLRDNSNGNSYGYTGLQRGHVTPRLGTSNGKQGLFMTVTDREIRLSRHSFFSAPASLGPDWVFPVGRSAPKPYAFATRAAGRSAPAFAPGAAVTCRPCESTPDKNGPSVACLRVDFPPAASVDGCRVFEYEVTASVVGDDVALPVKVKRVLAPGYHLPEAESRMAGTCLFALDDFPSPARLRFSVRPLECYGKAGAAISTDVQFRRTETCELTAVGEKKL